MHYVTEILKDPSYYLSLAWHLLCYVKYQAPHLVSEYGLGIRFMSLVSLWPAESSSTFTSYLRAMVYLFIEWR